MRILIVSPILPYPIKSGGQLRIYKLIQELSRQNEISLLSFASPGCQQAVEVLRGFCSRVEVVPVQKARGLASRAGILFDPRETNRHFGRARLLAGGAPIGAANLYHPEMASRLEEMLDSNHYDVVEINFCQMAHYLPERSGSRPATVLVDIDLAIATARRAARTARGVSRLLALAELRRLRHWAARMMPKFDAVVTMSDVDSERLIAVNPDIRTLVVPNGVDTSYFRFRNKDGRRMSMIYLGGTGHPPNTDALNYFAATIFPHIRNKCPLATLTVIGEADAGKLPLLRGDPAVELAGFVQDVRPRLSSAALMIVPLRIGGGTRLKILEAMSAGVPVLSTPVGCEGIETDSSEHIAVASDEQQFADLATQLLTDEEGRFLMATRARSFVEGRYSWRQIANDYQRSLSDLVRRGADG